MDWPNPYAIIADNEIQQWAYTHESAQGLARLWSLGRYETAKVMYLPTRTMQGHWHKGQRVS